MIRRFENRALSCWVVLFHLFKTIKDPFEISLVFSKARQWSTSRNSRSRALLCWLGDSAGDFESRAFGSRRIILHCIAWPLWSHLLSGSKKLCFCEVFTSVWASGLLPGYIRTYDSVRFSSPHGHREIKFEDNAAVRAWSEKLQSERGDSLVEGYISELQDFTRVNVAQNELQELRDIWASWDERIKQLFYQSYGDISYLLDIRVDRHLFWVIVQFWNSAYKCFTFGEVDLVPTMEEYTTLLRCPKIQMKERGSIFFTISIYGLVIFPKALRHMDEAVIGLFDRLEKGITPVPAILVETFRSLSSCRKIGEGRFIRCAQLLMVWFHGHFWKVDKVSYPVFSEGYSPLKEEGDIKWRAYWMVPDKIMYRCGNFEWVPLLGIWGATGYTPLLALRQYKSRQFVPMTYGLAQSEFSFKGANYKKKVRELSDA
ncbi:hypothetical protein CXB51_000459 [Gossypium anomalum]|uniref:DUF7745 domain-containing protein n=1 Tax=Gossypium anomalum TaxID=47600 RepID=A0A8J6DCK3_9ROSI|nr:hypothetical protein CXB51_000459 [Gossypium anomalum]